MTVPFWILVVVTVLCSAFGFTLWWCETEAHAATKKRASSFVEREVERADRHWDRLQGSIRRTRKLLEALRLIEQQATPGANATVTRMANVARNALAEHDDAVIREEARRAQ